MLHNIRLEHLLEQVGSDSSESSKPFVNSIANSKHIRARRIKASSHHHLAHTRDPSGATTKWAMSIESRSSPIVDSALSEICEVTTTRVNLDRSQDPPNSSKNQRCSEDRSPRPSIGVVDEDLDWSNVALAMPEPHREG
jgi:hypothetical protein